MLKVYGNSNITGNLIVGGYIKQQNASWCRGAVAINQSMQAGKINWSGALSTEINCSYNTTSRDIVIEIPGRYCISVTLLDDNVTTLVEGSILINDAFLYKIYVVTSVNNQHKPVSITLCKDLVAGDKVSVYNNTTIFSNLIHNVFCGFLIG